MSQRQPFWVRGERHGGLQKRRVRRTTAWSELAHPKAIHLADFLCGKPDVSCNSLSGKHVVLSLHLLSFI